MGSIKKQFLEDKALRDSAKSLIEADVAHIKSLFSADNLKERAKSQADTKVDGLKAKVAENAKAVAVPALGAGAALIGALGLYLAREPILKALSKKDDEASSEDTSSAAIDSTEESGENDGGE